MFEATSGDRGFSNFFAMTSRPNSHDNMLAGVCYSTIRTVTGREFVREKLSIALLFCRETSLSKPLLMDNMFTGVFSVFEEKCAWWP